MHKSQPEKQVGKMDVFDTVVFRAPDGQSRMPQQLLPRHCVQLTRGAKLHDELVTASDDVQVLQGTDAAISSFCAFYDRGKQKKTSLLTELKAKGITHVHVCGLAFDHAVTHTALAAAEHGFVTTVIEDACRAADLDDAATAREALAKASVGLVRSFQLKAEMERSNLKELLRAGTCIKMAKAPACRLQRCIAAWWLQAEGTAARLAAAPTPAPEAVAPAAAPPPAQEAVALAAAPPPAPEAVAPAAAPPPAQEAVAPAAAQAAMAMVRAPTEVAAVMTAPADAAPVETAPAMSAPAVAAPEAPDLLNLTINAADGKVVLPLAHP